MNPQTNAINGKIQCLSTRNIKVVTGGIARTAKNSTHTPRGTGFLFNR